MAWFFTEPFEGQHHIITGENAVHIEKSLRMKIGEALTLVDGDGMQYSCIIESFSGGCVEVRAEKKFRCENEPDVHITLYQSLPKGDKMDFIIQKAVELGVSSIVPVISARCISRPDEKSSAKKLQRWNKIALQAAQQSRRGIIPEVMPVITFSEAAENLCESDCNIIFYECGGERVGNIITRNFDRINIFIGSEGGFEKSEVEKIKDKGGTAATLGKRVLRAETAPLAALSIIMYITGNA